MYTISVSIDDPLHFQQTLRELQTAYNILNAQNLFSVTIK